MLQYAEVGRKGLTGGRMWIRIATVIHIVDGGAHEDGSNDSGRGLGESGG
jgi:hypothetical protein